MSNKAVIKIHPLPHSDAPLKKEVGQLSLDIYQTDTEIVILAPIAGVDKEDIHLSLTEDVLVIKGERRLHEVINEDSYYTKECFWGPFQRSIVLPLEAETTKLKASFQHNVLEIRIPKSDKKDTQIIKIKSDD